MSASNSQTLIIPDFNGSNFETNDSNITFIKTTFRCYSVHHFQVIVITYIALILIKPFVSR
jgi:hypothetical protein